ncbi:Hypothetical predicted protein [Pelobates cultripes]|uniref:Uncharacterized protein n=1 Tax=Pelobates cultripes TaxID=61616 RepID=A0AAD1W1C6_PELCU|nr:Hypothetical predicted protein [Pelobates cultripes]
MSHGSKPKLTKIDKASIFLAKAVTNRPCDGREESQDGSGLGSQEGSPSPPSSPTPIVEDSPLTVSAMKSFMADFSKQLQDTITGQIKSLVGELRKELQDLGLCMSHMEHTMSKHATAHNRMADQIQQMNHAIKLHNLKIGR